MNKIEEVNEKIDANKEILSTLPQNNKKNINIYLNKIEELKGEFTLYKEDIRKEMEKRVKKAESLKETKQKEDLRLELNSTEGVLYLLNYIETSYEKMDLDRAIQNLSYYYKKNLEIVNESILFSVKKFKEVGIEIKEEDFCFSNFVKEYINVLFYELKNGKENANSDRIKEKFEEIYWKCPDIITHIELNIRYIYLKNEKKINKYYKKQKKVLLKKFTSQEILDRYSELKKQINDSEKYNKEKIKEEFLNGKLNIKDFSETAIKNYYTEFIEKEQLEEMDENQLKELNNNIIKLSNTIYEYKKYLKFQFIIEDIKKIYLEKEKYKNVYNETKKEIAKKEKKVIKLNNRINGRGLFKKANDKLLPDQNNIILEIKEQYKELDQNKVYNKVLTELKETSTLSDVLMFASSFYKYLFSCIKNKYEEITEEEIDQIIVELREFVKWPYATIINNVGLLENKDILLIIIDRYKLLNINITKEKLEEENLDKLLEIIEKIEINIFIKENKINMQEIEDICELKKLLNK